MQSTTEQLKNESPVKDENINEELDSENNENENEEDEEELQSASEKESESISPEGSCKKNPPPPETKIPDNWEQLLLAPQPQIIQAPIIQPQPEIKPEEPPVGDAKPKKKLMKLNPNATAFKPTPVQQPPPIQQFQPSFNPAFGDFNYPPNFPPGYYGPQNGFPPMTMGGQMGGPPFPLYQQGEMQFNINEGFATFGRNAEQEEMENERMMDPEKIKEYREMKKKKKKEEAKAKKAAEDKLKGDKPKTFKRLEKKDGKTTEQPKKKKQPVLEEMELNEVEQSKFTEVDDSLSPVNIVFIGHVDVGKSTICGNILLLTGKVDKNELRKMEIEAKENKRETWYLAYVMDINKEERSKGKTVEVGKAHFQTKSKRFTILDAPGHKNYVPNMISGVSQADYAALVISAKTGEFESGFEKDGQTREHAMLAKTLGVLKLVVLVNKMDEVNWSKERFTTIKETLCPFLEVNCKFDIEKDVIFIPIAGLFGINLNIPVSPDVCGWYNGPCLFDLLDALPAPERFPNQPLRIPVLDKMKDMGLNIFGKVESGILVTDMTLTLMPFKKEFQVTHIFNSEDNRVKYAKPGENIRIKVKNIEEEDIKRGYMICGIDNFSPFCYEFEASITVLELHEHKPLITQGYKAIIHMHTVMEEIEVHQIVSAYDKEKNKQMKSSFLKSGMRGVCRLLCLNYMCLEKIETNPHIGRFTLRDEGKTIAFGEVLKIKPVKKENIIEKPVEALLEKSKEVLLEKTNESLETEVVRKPNEIPEESKGNEITGEEKKTEEKI